MNGDYLWDRTGSDAEVEQLERLLSPLKSPAGMAAPVLPWRPLPDRRLFRLAAAALLLASASAGWWMAGRTVPAALVIESMDAAFPEGAPVAAGSRLSVPAGARVLLRIADGSQVALGGPTMTRARLGGGRRDGNILALTEGRLEAVVAHGGRDEGEFRIQTPLGDVVDRGTRFVVEVERGEEMSKGGKAGTAVSLTVAVIVGWVELHEGGQSAPVPVRAGQTLVKEPGSSPRISAAASSAPQAPAPADAAERDRLREIDRLLDDPSRVRVSQGLSEEERLQARARAQKCGLRLRDMGTALLMFCDAHDGAYPSTIAQLYEAKPPLIDPKDLECPCLAGGTFIYLPPPSQVNWILSPATWILAHEDSPNPLGERNVLFFDCHSETMREAEFQKLLEGQKEVMK